MNLEHMNLTPEEQTTFDWCCSALNEEQIADCHDEAAELAGAELHEQQAADLLVPLLKKIMIGNVRRELYGGAQ